MKINLVEIGSCRGSGYKNVVHTTLAELQEYLDVKETEGEEIFGDTCARRLYIAISLGDYTRDELSAVVEKVSRGRIFVGDTEEGSVAIGNAPVAVLTKKAKIQYAESFL